MILCGDADLLVAKTSLFQLMDRLLRLGMGMKGSHDGSIAGISSSHF
jgi:hypothetical protein